MLYFRRCSCYSLHNYAEDTCSITSSFRLILRNICCIWPIRFCRILSHLVAYQIEVHCCLPASAASSVWECACCCEERECLMPKNERLIAARQARGWSQTATAEKVGISRAQYARLESGECMPHGSTVGLMCQAFCLSAADLGYPHIHLAKDLSFVESEKPPTSSSLSRSTSALYNLPKSNILVSPHQRISSLFFVEVNSSDCTVWFSEQLAQMVAFLQKCRGSIAVSELQMMLDRKLHMFDAVKAIFDADTDFPGDAFAFSRRQTLLAIASLPLGFLKMTRSDTEIPLINEELLSLCTASITACWHLTKGKDILSVERILSAYRPLLGIWVQQPSHSQRSVAYLAAQSCMLTGLVALHRSHFHQWVAYCRQAVEYAKVSQDKTLSTYALVFLGSALKDAEQTQAMLHTYQEAAIHLKEIAPLVQSKVLAGLARSYARNGFVQEALRHLQQARDVFPEEDGEIPCFISADCGLFQLILLEGKTYLDLAVLDSGKNYPQQALDALLSVERIPSGVIPDRLHLEILNYQTLAAVRAANLDAFQKYFIAGVEGARKLESVKRRQELISTYKEARVRWPQEPRVVELADLLLG